MPRESEFHVLVGSDADHGHALQICSVRIAGLKARRAVLVLQIFDGELLAFRARAAPFEFIRGKRADVAEDAVAGERGEAGGGGAWGVGAAGKPA